MRRLGCVLCIAGALALTAPGVAAAPSANLHEIKWFVHTDLVDAGMGMDVAFYETMLDAGLEDAEVALEGDQGPADTVCCSKLEKEEHSPGVTLAEFGTMGDGLDVMGPGDFITLSGIGGSGSRGFLIDSITDCDGVPGIGCATLPSCDSTPDDDPDLILVVTLDAQEAGALGLVIAHERGHNACLVHIASNTCDLMRAAVAGGCLASSECADFDDARQTTGGTCVCHADVPLGDPEDDGTACVDGPITGQCSGGVCGATPGDASVELFASGGPGGSSGMTTDDPLLQHAVTGGWTDLGSFSGTLRGLAYDPDGGVLYGVEDVIGDDRLVQVDPITGATSSPLVVTGFADLFGLAFDPGATSGSGDDRLLAIADGGLGFEDLIEIDPATGAGTLLAGINISPASSAWEGLAYDDINDRLYISGFVMGSLYEIDLSSCGNPGFCITSEVTAVDLPRMDPSLAFSRESGSLFLVGGQAGGRTLYDTIDATTFATSTTIGIDPYTPGGLAAIPVPEPVVGLSLPAGAALLGVLARRRSRRVL